MKKKTFIDCYLLATIFCLSMNSCGTQYIPQHVNRHNALVMDYSPYIRHAAPVACEGMMMKICNFPAGNIDYDFDASNIKKTTDGYITCYVVLKWKAYKSRMNKNIFACELGGKLYTNGKTVYFSPEERNDGLAICQKWGKSYTKWMEEEYSFGL
jgi:hypothetical protein